MRGVGTRVATGVFLALAVACRRGVPEAPTPTPPPTPVPSRVILFFPGDDGLLHGEARDIVELPAASIPRVRFLVEELAQGSQRGWAAAYPWPVTVLGAFVDNAGNAYVDLSSPPAGSIQGSAGEAAMLYATVSTVVVNCPGILRVQLLFDGREVETLGHLDLSRPAAPRPEFVAR